MRTTLSSMLLLATSIVLAQEIPLNDWTVPPYTEPSSGGITTMTDVTGPRVFVGIQPCRVADTRGNGAPIQGGIFPNGGLRTWTISGICGIPAGTSAISANFTVTGAPSAPPGAFLTAWPTAGPTPAVSILNYQTGQIVANAAIVPLSTFGQIQVNVSHSTHVIMDVNGYFSATLNSQGNGLYLFNSGVIPTATFQNTSASCSGICGVFGATSSGRAVGGVVDPGGNNSAGVFGKHGAPFSIETSYEGAGVRGEGRRLGVLGITNTQIAFGVGASGSLLNSAGTAAIAEGYMGYYTGTSYGVYSFGNAHVQGTFTATTKSFVQPHPRDASKQIQYVSLEGPHSEVYFRGTAQISRGVTRIPIPEHFRFVADATTYSTLVTPVGAMATVAVLSEGPEGIAVRASRDVKIHYVVYAEREAVRNPDPIVENIHFRPNPNTDFLAHLPDSFVKLMIENGTLNPDRTVNQETVRRLGWEMGSQAPLRAFATAP